MRILRQLAGPFFIFAGVMHFVIPKTYRRIVPPYVPAPDAIVYLSGVAEIVGGAGLLHPPFPAPGRLVADRHPGRRVARESPYGAAR
jgi:uncharacterized membrane protein